MKYNYFNPKLEFDLHNTYQENSNLDFAPLSINGCWLISPITHIDKRGIFIKSFIKDEFIKKQLDTNVVEEFISISKTNVIRGMHFQVPPMATNKFVSCLCGCVLDVILDLRRGSPTYKQVEAIEMRGTNPKWLYLPKGIAHGFLSLEDNSYMLYKVGDGYNSEYDKGVRWDSIGFEWPNQKPVMSNRDQNFPTFDEFISPFYYC